MSLTAIAIITAVGIMPLAARAIGEFVDANPTIEILALPFLTLVGMVRVADGLDFHVTEGYIHLAMVFSVAVQRFPANRE